MSYFLKHVTLRFAPYLGRQFDPSHTAKVPISTEVSPKGVHTVYKFLDPRPIYTLSTWAPVNCRRFIPLKDHRKKILGLIFDWLLQFPPKFSIKHESI